MLRIEDEMKRKRGWDDNDRSDKDDDNADEDDDSNDGDDGNNINIYQLFSTKIAWRTKQENQLGTKSCNFEDAAK